MSVAKNVKNLTSLPDKLNPTNISTAAEILEKIIKTQEKSMEVKGGESTYVIYFIDSSYVSIATASFIV